MRFFGKLEPKRTAVCGLGVALLAMSGCGDRSAATTSAGPLAGSVTSYAQTLTTADADAIRHYIVRMAHTLAHLPAKD